MGAWTPRGSSSEPAGPEPTEGETASELTESREGDIVELQVDR